MAASTARVIIISNTQGDICPEPFPLFLKIFPTILPFRNSDESGITAAQRRVCTIALENITLLSHHHNLIPDTICFKAVLLYLHSTLLSFPFSKQSFIKVLSSSRRTNYHLIINLRLIRGFNLSVVGAPVTEK